jgi:hypothetical protein
MKPTLAELSNETLNDLGLALVSVQKSMKKIWEEQFVDPTLSSPNREKFDKAAAIPAEPASPVFTGSAALALRKP